jgi:hypothetical protein
MGTTILSFCSHFLRGEQEMSLSFSAPDPVVLTLATTRFHSVEKLFLS